MANEEFKQPGSRIVFERVVVDADTLRVHVGRELVIDVVKSGMKSKRWDFLPMWGGVLVEWDCGGDYVFYKLEWCKGHMSLVVPMTRHKVALCSRGVKGDGVPVATGWYMWETEDGRWIGEPFREPE